MTETVKTTDDADEFDKAFDGFAGIESAAVIDADDDSSTTEGDDDEALAEDEEATRQAAASAEEDPLKDLPEDVRRRITEAEARAAEAEARAAAEAHSARSNAGRVSALQKKVDELSKSPLTKKAGGGIDDAAPGAETDADDDSFGEEYSEVAAFVERKVDEKVKPLQQKLDEQEAEEREAQERARVQEAFQKLAKAHPDFDQIRANPDYPKWLETQAPGIRNLAVSEDPADAIAICDLFKKEKGIKRTTSSREDLLAAAEEIPSKGGSRKTGVPDDYDAAYDHFQSQTRKR